LIARKIPNVLESFSKTFEKYIRQGKLEPSAHLILQAAEQKGATKRQVADAALESLERMLEDFTLRPLVRLCGEVDSYLPSEFSQPIKEKICPRIAVITDWSKKITLVARERQARELRAAVRARRFDEAERCVKRMLGPSPDQASAQYVGSILGSIVHGQREAEHLIGQLRAHKGRLGLTDDLLDAMDKTRRERIAGEARGRREFTEAAFVRDLNALTVELKGWLPGPRLAGFPSEEQIVRFYHALHALAATVFLTEDQSLWPDVTRLYVEFCPRELSEAGRRSGVEERAYMTLTPTARRTAFEAFGRLGRNETLVGAYLKFADTVSDERALRNVVEVMGAMRSKRFFPKLRGIFKNESRPSIRHTVMTAVSNYADGKAAEFLLKALAEAVRRGKRRGLLPEGPERRGAVQAIFAIGRIVRSPRMDPGGRNEILRRAITLVPEKDLRLQYELAYQCFLTPSEGWDARLRDWAVATLTRSFWLGDMTPDFAPGDDRGAGPLGWRAQAVQALSAIGRDAVPAILETCKEEGLRFGGAYIAVAETLGRIGDPRALPLLERLLANSLLQDTSQRTKYQAEKYYDPTEGVRKELDTDQVVSALLFAIERIGGEQAEEILVRAYNQIHSPGAPKIGSETEEILERIRAHLTREGRWNELLAKSAERPNAAASQAGTEGGERTRLSAAEALKILRSKMFWPGKRRPRKIQALQTLASLRNLEALPLIVSHLGDGDPLVRAAAETALGEYILSASNSSVFRGLTYALLEGLRSRDENIRSSVRSILKRLGPEREPLRSNLETLAHDDTDPLVRAEASRLLLEGSENDRIAALETAGGVSLAEAEPEQSSAGNEAKRKLLHAEILQKKREYLLARQAWIRGGKKGDPPKPPPEIMGQ